MEQIILSIDGEDLGPFSLDEVRALVEEGSATAQTLFWQEGMPGWEPLVHLLPELAVNQQRMPAAPAAPPPALVVRATPASAVASAAPPPEVAAARATAAYFRESALKQKAGGRALVLGWFFALIAIILALLAALPLFHLLLWLAAAATLIFAMVAMIRGRVAGGVLLILAVVLVPFSVSWIVRGRGLVFGPLARVVEPGYQQERIEFLDAQLERIDEVMRLSGSVRNAGQVELPNVQVVVQWKDEAGALLGTDSALVAGGRALQPGETAPFEVVAKNDPRMKKYTTIARFGP